MAKPESKTEKEAIDFEGIPFELCDFMRVFALNGKAKIALVRLSTFNEFFPDERLFSRYSDPDEEFRQAVVKVTYNPCLLHDQVATLVFGRGKCKRIERHEDCSDEDWDMVKAWASEIKTEYKISLENKGKL